MKISTVYVNLNSAFRTLALFTALLASLAMQLFHGAPSKGEIGDRFFFFLSSPTHPRSERTHPVKIHRRPTAKPSRLNHPLRGRRRERRETKRTNRTQSVGAGGRPRASGYASAVIRRNLGRAIRAARASGVTSRERLRIGPRPQPPRGG